MTYSIIIPQVRQEIEKIVAWKAKSYPPPARPRTPDFKGILT